MKITLPTRLTRRSVQSLINKLRANAGYRRTYAAAGLDGKPIQFPGYDKIRHRLIIEAQGPLLTTNDDGEYSSRDLTRWYAAQFCSLNHFTKALPCG